VALALFLMFAGGMAGLAAWAIMEPSAPPTLADVLWVEWSARFVPLLGGLIGATIGATYGRMQGSRAHLLRGLFGGLLLGAVGGSLGYQLGGRMAYAVFGNVLQAGAFTLPTILARIMALAPLGAFIGLVLGIPSKSPRRAYQGFIGGLIGGALGGAMFDIVSQLLSGVMVPLRQQPGVGEVEIGAPGRAIYSLVTGAAIGLCAAVVEQMGRRAWLRLRLGKNEGKDWVVDTAHTYIGSAETAQVPLFGDPSVIPFHACVIKRGSRYSLADGGSPTGTVVNGQSIGPSEVPLNHGDVVQIGSFVIEFLLRSGGASPQRDVQRAAQPVPIPVPAPAASPAPTTLVALDGVMQGRRFPLATTGCELGREGAHVQVPDPNASRRHARIAGGPAGWFVEDLGSTNGTFVNGARVGIAPIQVGDVVRLGSTSFRIE
jgi:pSer/pThr/pTyr-binding forkhead associated (FHA) protein/CDP-diglyceride synthetase